MFWHWCQQSITSEVKLKEKDGINSLPKAIYKINSKGRIPKESLWLECSQDIWIPPTTSPNLHHQDPSVFLVSLCLAQLSQMHLQCLLFKCSSKLITLFLVQHPELHSWAPLPFPAHFVQWLINADFWGIGPESFGWQFSELHRDVQTSLSCRVSSVSFRCGLCLSRVVLMLRGSVLLPDLWQRVTLIL